MRNEIIPGVQREEESMGVESQGGVGRRGGQHSQGVPG